MTPILRDYQWACVEAIERDWLFGGYKSVMAELPTGTGKTVIFAEIAKRFEGHRALVVCPMNILLAQAARKFQETTGTYPAIEQANQWSNESDWGRSQFVIASKQTLCKQRKDGSYRYQRFKDISLVIVDECHGSITAPFVQMIQHFIDQGANVLGMTATAKRHDKRALGNIYENCSYQYGVTDAVSDGWLVSCRSNCIRVKAMDLSKVATVAGDFAVGELNSILEQERVMLEIADITIQESGDLKTAIYCSSVQEAKGVSEILRRYGKQADFVCADRELCPNDKRHQVLRSFTKDPDGIQFLANVGILTTGWDFPGLQHIVMARPTKSLSLYTQVFGRGTRPLPGVVDVPDGTPEIRRGLIELSDKPYFRMTDLVDNSLEHKICTSVDVLAGKMGLDVVRRAKEEVLAAGGPIDVDKALKNAERMIAAEVEEQERQRRLAIKAKVEYERLGVNPYDDRARAPIQKAPKVSRMLWGKHKGKPMSVVPSGYLSWVLTCKIPDWYRRAINTELSGRDVPRGHYEVVNQELARLF